MKRVRLPGKRVALLISAVVVVVAIVGGVITGGFHTTSNTKLSPSASVLSPSYARSVGFSKVYGPARKVAVSNEKGCSSSVQAVYEDSAGKTGLISDLLNCTSAKAASAVLTAFRKQVRTDRRD